MEKQKEGNVAPYHIDEGFDAYFLKEKFEKALADQKRVFAPDPLFRGDQPGAYYDGMLAVLSVVGALHQGKVPFKVIHKITIDLKENATHFLLENGVDDKVHRRPAGDETLGFAVEGNMGRDDDAADVKLRRLTPEELKMGENDKLDEFKNTMVSATMLTLFQKSMSAAMQSLTSPSGKETPKQTLDILVGMTNAVIEGLNQVKNMYRQYQEKFPAEAAPVTKPTTEAPQETAL